MNAVLDLRKPIGWLFLIIGTMIAGRGALYPQTTPAGDLQVNLNLIWGAVMTLFGLWMTLISSRPGSD